MFGCRAWLPRYAYVIRTSGEDVATQNLGFTMAMTFAVMTIEDIPQLVLMCIYLATSGFGFGGGIAEFAFFMSLLSITFNLGLLVHERNRAIKEHVTLKFLPSVSGHPPSPRMRRVPRL